MRPWKTSFEQTLKKKGYSQQSIEKIENTAKEIYSARENAPLICSTHAYGSGKSTGVMLCMECGDIFAMENYNQLDEKIEDFRNLRDEKVIKLVGKGRFLKEQDYTWNPKNNSIKNGCPIEKVDLEALRDKSDITAIEKTYKQTESWKATFDIHSDEPIIKAYGKQFDYDVVSNTVWFTVKDLIPLLNRIGGRMSNEGIYFGDLFVDEGGEYDHSEELTKPNSALKKVSTYNKPLAESLGYKPTPPNFNTATDVETHLESLSLTAEKMLKDLFRHISNIDSTSEINKRTIKTYRLRDGIDEEDMRRLERTYNLFAVESKNPHAKETLYLQERKAQNKISELMKIYDLMEIVEWFLEMDGLLSTAIVDEEDYPVKFGYYRPQMFDFFDWTRYDIHGERTENACIVMDASANSKIWEWRRRQYEEMEKNRIRKDIGSENLNRHKHPVEITGLEYRVPSLKLEGKLEQYDWGNKMSVQKREFDRGFMDTLAEIIKIEAREKADGKNDISVAVITPKSSPNGKSIPKMFQSRHSISIHFNAVEGSNIVKRADPEVVYIIGSPRLPEEQFKWKVYKNSNITAFDDDPARITKRGSQTGYENPYLHEHFRSMVHLNIIEKLFRARPNENDVTVRRLGLNPIWTDGDVFIDNEKGDRFDMIDNIVEDIGFSPVIPVFQSYMPRKWAKRYDSIQRKEDGSVELHWKQKVYEYLKKNEDATRDQLAKLTDYDEKTIRDNLKDWEVVQVSSGGGRGNKTIYELNK